MHNFKILTFFLVALLGLSTCSEDAPQETIQVSLDQMSPDQLLGVLNSSITELNDTQSILRENAEVADQNATRVENLKAEGANLDTRMATYDAGIQDHNRQANSYIERCQNGKLPEDVYTQCLTLKQNLDMQKSRLDSEVETLSADHDAYNQKVLALNAEENDRVEAVGVLLETFRRVEQEIRDIQVRLYDVAVALDRNGFSEEVRQCNTRVELEDMYSCMTSVWGN